MGDPFHLSDSKASPDAPILVLTIVAAVHPSVEVSGKLWKLGVRQQRAVAQILRRELVETGVLRVI
jgi:hypothetical protein